MGDDAAATAARPSSADSADNTSYAFVHLHHNLSVYDFAQSAGRDWDKTFEGAMNLLQFTKWNGLNIGRLALAFWILASHLALLILLLCKASLRSQPKYLLIVNVSLTNLLLGVFIIPVKLHFTLGGGSCRLNVAWTLLNDYFQVCVSLLAVFTLVLERLVYVFTERRGTYLTRLATWINCALYFALPWLLAVILVVPVFFEALAQRVQGAECAWRVKDYYFLALQVLSFLPAALAVFVTAPLAGLWDCLRHDACAATPSTPKGESLVVGVLVSLLAVCGEAPYFTVRVMVLGLQCDSPYCSAFNQGVSGGMWLRLAKAALMPFIWLVYSDLRDAMLCRIRYKKAPRNNRSDHVEEDEQFHLVNTRM